MGMSTYVTAFTSPKEPEYAKHKAVYDFCRQQGVSLPKETEAYFDGEPPEDKLAVKLPVQEWGNREYMQEGFELLVKDIPAGVHKIRFYNSY